jgi:hypothetical protein
MARPMSARAENQPRSRTLRLSGCRASHTEKRVRLSLAGYGRPNDLPISRRKVSLRKDINRTIAQRGRFGYRTLRAIEQVLVESRSTALQVAVRRGDDGCSPSGRASRRAAGTRA